MSIAAQLAHPMAEANKAQMLMARMRPAGDGGGEEFERRLMGEADICNANNAPPALVVSSED